jgi:heavy metal translocating P-type ATPase
MNESSKPHSLLNPPQRDVWVAGFVFTAILSHLLLKFFIPRRGAEIPLVVAFALGGIPILIQMARRMFSREMGTDFLAGVSILTSFWFDQYLAGTIVILMFSGGQALERWASKKASAVLEALARRMPRTAHRLRPDGKMDDVPLEEVAIGDHLIVLPQESCPVDGTVTDGQGRMDESYLTGEPFEIAKTPGATVFSGAINKNAALTIRAEKRAVDSRYAKIMQVMQSAESNRPRLRRLADRLGAWYTPLALAIAGIAWMASGEKLRFLSVLIVATPCPLLIAVPVAVIGAISLAAKRGIIIKNPAALELIANCRTLIFDKTGTLTYGRPTLTEIVEIGGFTRAEILRAAASLEQYSKHPLSAPILFAARESRVELESASPVSEKPGQGLVGIVAGRSVQITGRHKISDGRGLPPTSSGLECVVLIAERCAALFRFHDSPRQESKSFIGHLNPHHEVTKIMLVSGDRESEVRYLAESVGIQEVHASQSPEDKVAIVKQETARQQTLFIGDGINDAPALATATVGVAFGPNSDIASEAADAVILEASLQKVDELFHISRRMRTIALQSALGGMAVSIAAMAIAAGGYLTPVEGAILQEVIDLAAVLNAVRAAMPPKYLSDYSLP